MATVNDREAQEIVRMIEGTWKFDLDAAGRAVWRDGLAQFDPEIATRAVAYLSTRMSRWPKLADIRQVIAKFERDERMKNLKQGLKEPTYTTPEWVWVWKWARTRRDPREDRSFPQQERWGDPLYTMSRQDYDALREEWVEAGSPKFRAEELFVST